MNAFLVIALAVTIVIAIGTYKWLPIPFLTYSQGRRPMEGTVTSVESQAGGLIKVSLAQGLQVGPIPKASAVISMSGSCTSYVYFRSDPELEMPKVGMHIRAGTTNRNYRLRGVSLNWVDYWVKLEAPTTGGSVVFIAGAGEAMEGVASAA